jgi:CheY-like chemotaxis protein
MQEKPVVTGDAGARSPGDFKRILVVDDEPMMRELLRAMLRTGGYLMIGEAMDTAGTLALCAEQQPDAVLLDIELRGESGLDVLARLRERFPRLPVVMISGSVFADKVRAAKELGAHGFVAKPFNNEILFRTLDRALAAAPTPRER